MSNNNKNNRTAYETSRLNPFILICTRIFTLLCFFLSWYTLTKIRKTLPYQKHAKSLKEDQLQRSHPKPCTNKPFIYDPLITSDVARQKPANIYKVSYIQNELWGINIEIPAAFFDGDRRSKLNSWLLFEVVQEHLRHGMRNTILKHIP